MSQEKKKRSPRTGRKPAQTPYRTKPRTPASVRNRVFGRHAAGQTKRAIAKAEGLARNTVIRILAQDERREIIQGFRDECLDRLVKKAIIALEHNLDQMDRQAAVDTLRGTKIFTEHIEIEAAREPERDYASTRVLFYEKFGRWPKFEEIQQFEKTIDVPLLTKGSR